MRDLAATCFAIFLTGCSLSSGPVIVHSPSLGFESPYLGAMVRGDLDGERFIARAEGGYYNAQKIQTSDGYGLSASALAGAKFGRFLALAGYRWNKIDTSAYTKDSSQLLAEAGYHFKSGGTVFTTYAFDPENIDHSYGLRCEVPFKRILMLSTWEHIDFDAQDGTTASGDKVSLGALWRF